MSWDDGEADREWRCLSLIWDHAPGTAPRPLRRETADGHPVVVMERVPGLPLGGGPLSAAQNDSLGAALGRLYRIPVEHIAAAGISERRFGPSTLPPALTAWLQEACDLSPCQEPALVADAVDAAREWLFRPGLLPPPQLTGLGIADLNPANVLWDGRICRLVDFEYGGLTDPAYDLADHVEHIAARLSGVFDPEALPAAAGASADARERMRAYRPLWAVHWLAMLLPGNGGFRRNPPGTTESQARHVTALIG
ncbi:aminoglycoside phosphotransferase family protein [Microbacterium sp.]|uniref:aminoglycoside phosphotransferase family protein n=1 Tax=Microbacterium sp. TaxID=51671 RepID=UPI003341C74E